MARQHLDLPPWGQQKRVTRGEKDLLALHPLNFPSGDSHWAGDSLGKSQGIALPLVQVTLCSLSQNCPLLPQILSPKVFSHHLSSRGFSPFPDPAQGYPCTFLPSLLRSHTRKVLSREADTRMGLPLGAKLRSLTTSWCPKRLKRRCPVDRSPAQCHPSMGNEAEPLMQPHFGQVLGKEGDGTSCSPVCTSHTLICPSLSPVARTRQGSPTAQAGSVSPSSAAGQALKARPQTICPHSRVFSLAAPRLQVSALLPRLLRSEVLQLLEGDRDGWSVHPVTTCPSSMHPSSPHTGQPLASIQAGNEWMESSTGGLWCWWVRVGHDPAQKHPELISQCGQQGRGNSAPLPCPGDSSLQSCPLPWGPQNQDMELLE